MRITGTTERQARTGTGARVLEALLALAGTFGRRVGRALVRVEAVAAAVATEPVRARQICTGGHDSETWLI